MKKFYNLFFLFFIQTCCIGQVMFVERFETETKFSDNNFMMMNRPGGLIAFRAIPEKGFTIKSKLQFFRTDYQLNATPIKEIILRDGYELIGYDLEEGFFYALLQKGTTLSDNRYIIEINLKNDEAREINITNVLGMELGEFLVLNRKAVFMGITDLRPVVQIFDLESNNVFTVQGIYSKDAKILQLRKDSELGILDILISKRDQFKMKQVSVLTFDEFGNKIREVAINRLEDPSMEIVEGILTPIENFQQNLIGPFGQRRREAFQGVFLTEINEFGEYKTKYYTLEDFPNFYNYLSEKAKVRKLRQLERDYDKGRIPSIRSVMSTREVIDLDQGMLIYNDLFTASHPRYFPRDGVYANTIYRSNPFYNPNMMYGDPITGYRGYPRYHDSREEGEYKFISAHFAMIDNSGKVVWDNSLDLDTYTTSNPGKFGKVSFDGEKLHYLYLDKNEIIMSYIRNGEVIFENEPYELELIDENERIRETQDYGMQLTWWFDDYFLLSGKQRIRFQNESGKEEIKEVFFMTKIKVDGDQFVPEEEG